MSTIETGTFKKIATAKMAMWCFLGGEIVVFGGLISVFVLVSMFHADAAWWVESRATTMFAAGFINTIVLLTSSLTIVLAFKAVDEKQDKKALMYLGITLLFAFVFLVVKAIEYTGKFSHDVYPSTNLFWSFYFFMTGLHAVHVIGGIIAMFIIGFGVLKGKNLQRIEYVGLYWHLVDIVWIFLFPLFYVGGAAAEAVAH